MWCPKDSRYGLQRPIEPDRKLGVSHQNTVICKEYTMQARWWNSFKGNRCNDCREGAGSGDKLLEEGGKDATRYVSLPHMRDQRTRTGKSPCVAAAKNIRLIVFPLTLLNFPTNVRINQARGVEKYLRRWPCMTDAKEISTPMTKFLLTMCRLGQFEV